MKKVIADCVQCPETVRQHRSITPVRLIGLIFLVLALLVAGNVQADTTWTGADPADNLWSTAGNWDAGIPDSADWAKIRNGLPGPTIASEGAVVKRVHIGYAEGGALTMSSGTLDIVGDDLMIGKQGGTGILNMNGGTITVARDLEVAGESGNGGPGFLYMTGGTIIVGDDFEVPEAEADEPAIAEVYLYDGTIILDGSYEGDSHLRMYERGIMDIHLGTLILGGDEVSRVQGYIDNGLIVGYGGAGEVLVDFDIANAGMTTVTAVPEPATLALLGLGGLALRRRR